MNSGVTTVKTAVFFSSTTSWVSVSSRVHRGGWSWRGASPDEGGSVARARRAVRTERDMVAGSTVALAASSCMVVVVMLIIAASEPNRATRLPPRGHESSSCRSQDQESLHSMDADFTRRVWRLKRSMRDRDEEWQRREGGTSPARLPWGPWKARISRFQGRIHYMDADFTRHVWGLKRSIRGS